MTKRGRRASLIPMRTLKDVPLPAALIERVDARLHDPVTGRPAYGARAALIARLLSEWCDRTPVHPSFEPPLDLESLVSTPSDNGVDN